MPTNARLVELAQLELSEAMAYYEAQASMGLAFTNEFDRVIDIAMEFPDSGTLVPQRRVRRQIRLFRLNPEFRHDIVATVIEEEDLLLVVAVAHHARKPNYWISRLAQVKR